MYTIHPLPEAVRHRVVARMMRENGFTRELAESVMDETLAYLHATAKTELPIGPSKIVDIGWHHLILHSRAYAAYCQAAFGEFIHHEPAPEGEVGLPLADTIAFFEANGIAYDPDLWGMTAFCDSRGGGGNDGSCSRTAPYTDPTLAMADQLGNVMVADCDGGRGGGDSMCGRGNCS